MSENDGSGGGKVGIFFTALGCCFVQIIIIGISMGVIRLFNPNAPDPGLPFFLTIPLLVVAFIASQDPDEIEDGFILTVIVFTYATALSIVCMIGHWFFFVAWLAAFLLFYAKKIMAGGHYLFVARPLLVETGRAQAAKDKLNDDAEIAEATIKRERARAALLDAEREVEEAKRRMGKGHK